MVHNEIKIIKAPEPAWAFCARQDTNDFLEAFLPDATMALLHTRFATIGNPQQNQNNHPMFLGRAAIVHNGGISNHAHVFDTLKMDRSCETDSDVFRAIIDRDGMTPAAIKDMNSLAGSAAIGAMSQDDPEKLIIARSGSPLTYGLTEDKLWFASEIHAIQRAVRPWEQHHGLFGRKFRADVAYFGVPDHTAYLLDPNGLEGRFEFKVCAKYNQPIYRMRETYSDKMSAFRAEEARRVKAREEKIAQGVRSKSAKCANSKCETLCIIPETAKFADYTCPSCKGSLRALDALKPEQLMFTIQEEE